MINKNDWRLTNQDNYLKNVKLIKSKYTLKVGHEHCAFCWYKFKQDSDIGYCTLDKYHWICECCYNDFEEMFNWELIE